MNTCMWACILNIKCRYKYGIIPQICQTSMLYMSTEISNYLGINNLSDNYQILSISTNISIKVLAPI